MAEQRRHELDERRKQKEEEKQRLKKERLELQIKVHFGVDN